MQDPLVLLPGMMCDARLFEPQIAAISSGRAVMTAPLTGADTMEGLAAVILAIAPPRFALAGLSMGGILAMEVIRQAPERVSRLALLDTNPLAEVPERAVKREPQVERVRRHGLERVMREEIMPHYLAAGSDPKGILDVCWAMAEACGAEVFASQSHALRDRPDQSDTLRGVTVPTLVLCGAEDALCPLERHQLMHDLIPGSQLAIIEGAGHLPTLEQPDKTNEALNQWLKQ